MMSQINGLPGEKTMSQPVISMAVIRSQKNLKTKTTSSSMIQISQSRSRRSDEVNIGTMMKPCNKLKIFSALNSISRTW